MTSTGRRGFRWAVDRRRRRARCSKLAIVAVTGNDLNALMPRIEGGQLPWFEAIIGAVGTEIWILHSDCRNRMGYVRDAYFDRLLRAGAFERRMLSLRACSVIDGLRRSDADLQFDFQDPASERALLDGQQGNAQPFKISFFFFARSPEHAACIGREVRQQFPGNRVLVCEEIHYNWLLRTTAPRRKYCLDILPITKAEAVDYLCATLGVDVAVVAGDSGNDVDMLVNSSASISILVGGATQEAVREIDMATLKKGNGCFRRFRGRDGAAKWCYVEETSSGRLGPDSILQAATILQRAASVKSIRAARTQAPMPILATGRAALSPQPMKRP